MSSYLHHFSFNHSCKSSIYFTFVITYSFHLRLPLLTIYGELPSASNLLYERSVGENITILYFRGRQYLHLLQSEIHVRLFAQEGDTVFIFSINILLEGRASALFH